MSGVFSWLVRRERALRQLTGDEQRMHRSIYGSMEPFCAWNKTGGHDSQYGGIFNLEFSPDGSMLVAACEKRSLLIFDPITNKVTKAIRSAHRDSVNCIKFLDNHLFASCSDDTTIALWDTRNLAKKLRILHGHMNWVKNIEYSPRDHQLVTSGFDGSVFTWDINSYTERSLVYKKVFSMSGLMRCRISPDARTLVISTTGGYLIVVHNLNLSTLSHDLAGFRPNIYRLMQIGNQYLPFGALYDHMFTNSMKHNRVQFISDFPETNDAEVISSLQIHPQGWCALSRNVNYEETSEWTTVHDIQDDDPNDVDTDNSDNGESDTDESHPQSAKMVKLQSRSSTPTSSSSATSASTSRPTVKSRKRVRNEVAPRPQPPVLPSGPPDIWAAEVSLGQRSVGPSVSRHAVGNSLGTTHVYGISSGVLNEYSESGEPEPLETAASQSAAAVAAIAAAAADGDGNAISRVTDTTNPTVRIRRNSERLLKFIEEPNKGKGYIKELCFSDDGRLICSPYGLGIRLLAFSPDCAELPSTLHPDGRARPLTVLKYIKCHSDIVVCTKFSPRQPLLASGCLMGKVVWHQPAF